MPKGTAHIQKNENNFENSDFFDLKENGDQAIVTILGEPFVLPFHKLDDPDKEKYKWGRKFACGAADLNACPVCEGNGTYKASEKATKTKIYLPVYVHMFKAAKDTAWTEIKAMKVMSGDGVFQDGFTEYLDTQATFGAKPYGIPVLVKRVGDAPKNTFPFAALPSESAAKYPVPKDEKPLDEEDLALKWVYKGWEDMGYTPSGHNAPAGSPPAIPVAIASGATATAPDPFNDLPE